MDPSVAKQGGSTIEVRDYRKGNWTVEETMVLIEAKKMDDERRLKRLGDGGERGKPAELRWKWVEDYCWKHECFRSQNQCNDKWDNLMRDFKKVKEYEGRAAESGGGERSYWRIEKNQRKEKNLPSNMLPQIYQALMAVTERKGQRAIMGSGGAGSSTAVLGHPFPPLIKSPTTAPPPFPPLQTPGDTPVHHTFSHPLPTATVDSESSHSQEKSESPAKRSRKRRERDTIRLEEVGSAISRSASMIAEAMQASEERGERRHREMVSLQERRLRIEESKAEISRQGIHGLTEAINKLANSILTLANQQPSPK